MYRLITVAAAVAFSLSTAVPAGAIEWPLRLSDAKQHGESATVNAILTDSAYELSPSDENAPAATLMTPFKFAAFVYASKKATYADLKPSDLAEIKRTTYLEVLAHAFSTILGANDDMVTVLKQGQKIIRPTKSDRPNESVTEYPEVGYRTIRTFTFALSALNLHQPFSVVVANAVNDRGMGKAEATWTVDPSRVR